MTIEYDYPDLRPLTSGASFSLIIQHLYYAHLLRYSTPDLLKDLTKSVKIATKNKLQSLCDLGYLVNNGGVLVSTHKTLDLLENQGYSKKLLPQPARGNGSELYNSLQLAKLIKHPLYKILLYPHFDYVIPDGLLVLQDGDRYQLNFIEVEAKKPNWKEHLEGKRANYERLARDERVYRYWQGVAPHVGLPVPKIEDFKFQVRCFSEITFDWRGWRFESP